MVHASATRDPSPSDYLERFRQFAGSLTPDERLVLKEQLSAGIVQHFDDDNSLKADSLAEDGFPRLAHMLRACTERSDRMPLNGIAYRGFPQWLTDPLLRGLQAEAEKRRHEPLDRTDHFLGCGGELADELANDEALVSFVEKCVGRIAPTGIASYLFYDRAGLGIRPHVDTEVFSLNLMIMLRHDVPASLTPSATRIFPAEGPSEEHRLAVGEAMLMYGNSVVHTRSPIAEGEVVHLLTIGFSTIDVH